MSKVTAGRPSEAPESPDPQDASPAPPIELSEKELEGVAGGDGTKRTGKTFLIFVCGPEQCGER
jgi:hypothetical protein